MTTTMAMGGGTGQTRKWGTIVEEREEMEVEEENGEEAECVTFLSRKSKLGMMKLLCLNILLPDWRRQHNAPINGAHAFSILGDASACASIAKYLT